MPPTPEYATNNVKVDPATGAVAIRTQFPDDDTFGHMAWLVATPNVGARNARTSELADWSDTFEVSNGQVVLPTPGA